MKALVLLSGGLDSATCLALAIEKHGCDNVQAISVEYGQRHQKEIEAATRIAKHYGIKLHVIDLRDTGIFDGSKSTLFTGDIPSGTYASQQAPSTYVPFRNGLFASIIAAKALSLSDEQWTLYMGIHSDDYCVNAYPDCSKVFSDYMNKAIQEGTSGRVFLDTPFAEKTKTDVVRIGLKLEVPYELTWSCYQGEEKPCGICATCLDRAEAFSNNNTEDPALI